MHVLNWTPTKNDRLCSKHFLPNLLYHIGERTCLVDDAVPTIFSELPKYMQKESQQIKVSYRFFKCFLQVVIEVVIILCVVLN